MGVSTDGILVFGIEITDEDTEAPPEFLEGFEDFEEYIDSLSGLPRYGEPGHSFDDQRAFREKCPADMVLHCSYDYPMYILAVRGTETRAWRGHPKVIDPEDLAVDESKITAFKAWAAERGIEGDPKWILCSNWG